MQFDPPLSRTELNDLVIQFQECSQSNDKLQASRIFEEILKSCKTTIRSIQAKYKSLGSYVEDEASSILGKCLLRFKGGDSFKGYFSKALCNAANSECRRRGKMRGFSDGEKDDLIDTTTSFKNPMDNNDEIELYVSRKRWLVDQLQLRPAMKMATLLLDQRLRCAKLVYSSVLGQISEWVEGRELWHGDDYARRLDCTSGPEIGSVWCALAKELESTPESITQESMVRSIEVSGGNVNLETWRQRVCRYLQAVRDQVSEEEYRYFHPTI
jgi:hypothetical protein